MLPKQSVVGLYLAAVFVLLICISHRAAGQAASPSPPKVMAPHRPVAPRVASPSGLAGTATLGSMVGGLWMTDANFKSSIYLKNVVETSSVTITPILYLSNGTKYTLSDVTLEPSGTAIIDISQGLQQQGIASYTTLTGYVELQYSWPWDPICATIRNVDVAHSLIFTYGLKALAPLASSDSVPAAQTQVLEGMWWKQESNVTGFVSLANTTSNAITATVHLTDNQANGLSEHAVTIFPHGTKIVALPELLLVSGTEGGIRVSYTAAQEALVINGGVEDQAVGYSAILPFGSGPAATAKTSDVTITELGLMVGAADPMMSFPAATKFTPYSVVRNVTNAPVSVTPTLWWMEAGSARSAQLRQLTLAPLSSQSLNVMSLLSAAGLANFSGSANLVFDGQITPGSLLFAAGSVDQTNTYVFEVVPRSVVESVSKSLAYWSIGNGDDTMVTLWNPADEAQDLVFRLSFSSGHYLYPIHLGPRASHTFNVSEIVHNQVPDSEGNIIPPGVYEGSAKISGSQAENEHILVAIDAATYNIRKATCGYVCFSCDGYTSYGVSPSSFSIGAGGTQQLAFVIGYNTGQQYDDTSYSYWTSNNTNVATVSMNTSGLVTGVSNGSATITAQDSVYNPPYVPYQCFPTGMNCPISEDRLGGEASATVQICPTGVTLQSSTPFSLAAQFPSLKTGIGIGAAMQVSPSTKPNGTSWNGTQITEYLVPTINTCPASFGNQCSTQGGFAPFTVGNGGRAYGITFPATTNIFYDQHTTVASTSWLNAPGAPNACTVSCAQTYSCNGGAIGNFTVFRAFNKGTIQGTPVTTVTVTKQ